MTKKAPKKPILKKPRATKAEIEQAAHAEHSKVLLAAEDARLAALERETPQEATHHFWNFFRRFLVNPKG